MAEHNYLTPSNSKAALIETAQTSSVPKVEKVVTGNVVLKPKSKGEQFAEDGKAAIKSVVENTIAPSIKDMILNAIWNGLSLIFFPDGSRRPRNSSTPAGSVYYGSSYTSYGSYYNRSSAPTQVKPVSVTEPAFRNPLMASMQDANAVIDAMRDTIRTYGFATWSTLYDLCGMDNQNWAGTTKYGWTSVESTIISTVALTDGSIAYELRMPKASPIDDTPF